jgi:hypothetical protein
MESGAAGELGSRAGGANDASKSGGSGSSFNADSTSRTLARQLWAGGRKVGEVRGEVYHKTVRTSRGHMLQKPPAWAFANSVLDEVERLGARTVVVEDLDTGRVWRAALADVRAHGFAVHRPGWEPQTGLPLGRWQQDGEEPQPAWEPERKPIDDRQLALF